MRPHLSRRLDAFDDTQVAHYPCQQKHKNQLPDHLSTVIHVPTDPQHAFTTKQKYTCSLVFSQSELYKKGLVQNL